MTRRRSLAILRSDSRRTFGGLMIARSFVILLAILPVWAVPETPKPRRTVVRVGIDDGAVRGSGQRPLQAAHDGRAHPGGGTVEIAAGRYTLRHPVHLRSNVTIVGVPGKTVLVVGAGRKSALAHDVRKGSSEITLVDAAG